MSIKSERKKQIKAEKQLAFQTAVADGVSLNFSPDRPLPIELPVAFRQRSNTAFGQHSNGWPTNDWGMDDIYKEDNSRTQLESFRIRASALMRMIGMEKMTFLYENSGSFDLTWDGEIIGRPDLNLNANGSQEIM
jgi:hypothetical protein